MYVVNYLNLIWHIIFKIFKKSLQKAPPFGGAETALYSKSVACVGKQCDMSCTLDSNCKLTLMMSTCTCYSSGQNLSSFGHIAAKSCYIFIVNSFNLVHAESTNLSATLTTAAAVILFRSFSHNKLSFIRYYSLQQSCVNQKNYQNGRSSSSGSSSKSSGSPLLYAAVLLPDIPLFPPIEPELWLKAGGS